VSVPTRDAEGAYEIEGEATLFGYDPTPLVAKVIPRGRGWRVGGAARTMALFVPVAVVVVIFPPHAVWPIGALLTGAFLARRRYVERYTLRALDGTCPKCGTPFRVKPGRLLIPHPIPCEGCHHEPTVRLPRSVLDEIAGE
jgi:hypothetical protein